MKHIFLAGFLFLSVAFYATAQSESSQDADSTIFTRVEKAPLYPGGHAEFMKYVQLTMVYPKEARIKRTEGTVYVAFVVEKTGEISNVSILKGLSAECDAEAARVIRESKPWIPGQVDGKPVSVKLVLPMNFSLSSKQKE
jgi:periplasmic protein TonB